MHQHQSTGECLTTNVVVVITIVIGVPQTSRRAEDNLPPLSISFVFCLRDTVHFVWIVSMAAMTGS
jgi:hypothetical protein